MTRVPDTLIGSFDHSAFRARLRGIMAETYLNQTQLARKAEISTAYVNDLLHGRRDGVSLDVAERLAAALGVSLTTLDAPVRIVVGTARLEKMR